MNRESKEAKAYESGDAQNKGYRFEEARQFIEFCVELDNQDDRQKNPNDPELRPAIDPTLWNPRPVYDSRVAVARDVVNFKNQGPIANDKPWSKLFERIIGRANATYPSKWGEQDVCDNPNLNGFGPWQNVWLLYEGRGPHAGAYAIAIRGTVFSNIPSAVEDAIFQSVSAKGFLSQAVQFADADAAALHSGFAHAVFTLLLDDRYGVLRVLSDRKISKGSTLYIVGHSQGAAMATLTHAFLHYALRNDSQSGDPAFGLKDAGYKLKSYAIAQPKPGDYRFSADFARITQTCDNAIVINNHIDPVPQVPLTLQATGDLTDDFKGAPSALKVLHLVSGLGLRLRKLISLVAEPFVRKSAEGYGYYYNYDKLKPLGKEETASSWNFTAAGRVILVFGVRGDPKDLFLQHHATTYRKLIATQLTVSR